MSPENLQHVRAEALFVSDLQGSDRLTAGRVRDAVLRTVRRHGARGCAGLVAQEFGEHPDIAAARMGWVLSIVRATYLSYPPGRMAGCSSQTSPPPLPRSRRRPAA